MCPDALTSEQREFADRAARETARLSTMLGEVAEAYLLLNPEEFDLEDERREQGFLTLEASAAVWRRAERAWATEAGIERETGAQEQNDLLGAITDSLVLALSAAAEHRRRVIASDEVVARFAQMSGEAAPAETTEPPDTAVEDDAVHRFDALCDATLAALAEVSALYRELAPDGRALEAGEADRARHASETAALRARDLDANRSLLTLVAGRRDLRPSVYLLRCLQYSLILALSSEPDRRARAIGVPELIDRLRPVYEGWKATAEQGHG